MSVLSIDDLSFSIGGRPLLEHASLMVDEGRRIGLIGRNGAGKSTLLKLIAGTMAKGSGWAMLRRRPRPAR
jgi:ATP-binding cassette subfamily F protein 3